MKTNIILYKMIKNKRQQTHEKTHQYLPLVTTLAKHTTHVHQPATTKRKDLLGIVLKIITIA